MDQLFDIHHRLIGERLQAKLWKSSVAVVGLGGLGCTVAQALTRMGVGSLLLIDADKVALSNLPRQVLFRKGDIGKYKVEAAREKLISFPSHPRIRSQITNLSRKNSQELLADALLVMDCTDNYASRYAISHAAENRGIPMIFGGVNKFEGQVGVFGFQGSRPFHKAFPDLEILLQQESCEASGVMPFVVQLMGNLQAAEAFKILTGQGEILDNQLMCWDMLNGKQRTLRLS